MKTEQTQTKDEQNSPFNEALAQVRKAYNKCLQGDAMARYKLGEEVRSVMQDEAKYGEGAVDKIAASLGVAKQTLYNAATVAERWTPNEFKAILNRRDKRKKPLSWTHLVELAGVDDDNRRQQLEDEAISKGLSVRELQKRVSPPTQKDGNQQLPFNSEPQPTTDSLPPESKDDDPQAASVNATLPESVPVRYRKAAQSLGTSVDQTLARLLEELTEMLPEDYEESDIEALRNAKEHHVRVRDFCDTALTEIDKVLGIWEELLEEEPETYEQMEAQVVSAA